MVVGVALVTFLMQLLLGAEALASQPAVLQIVGFYSRLQMMKPLFAER